MAAMAAALLPHLRNDAMKVAFRLLIVITPILLLRELLFYWLSQPGRLVGLVDQLIGKRDFMSITLMVWYLSWLCGNRYHVSFTVRRSFSEAYRMWDSWYRVNRDYLTWNDLLLMFVSSRENWDAGDGETVGGAS